jgi:hypothetical protein
MCTSTDRPTDQDFNCSIVCVHFASSSIAARYLNVFSFCFERENRITNQYDDDEMQRLLLYFIKKDFRRLDFHEFAMFKSQLQK